MPTNPAMLTFTGGPRCGVRRCQRGWPSDIFLSISPLDLPMVEGEET